MSSLGRLLIVDDEVELMTVLRETLAKQGYETHGLTTGAEALEALKDGNYDLLLADLMMPGIDGITLLRKGLEIDPQLIGIIMTGQGTVPTAVEAMQVGAFDYVLKPFKLQNLLPILARALELRRLRLENIQLRDTVAIYDLSQTIALTLDAHEILERVVEAALEQSEGDEASVLLNQADGLYVAAVRGGERDQILGQRIPFEPSIAGWVAKNQQPVILNGKVSDDRFAPLFPRGDIHASVSVPMMAAGKLVGVLNVNTLRARPFNAGQVKALSILANTAAVAIEQGALFRALRESEERFRIALQGSPVVVFNHDRDLRYTWIYNPALGYRAEEVVGFLDSDIFMPEAAERLMTLKRGVLESGVGTRQEVKVIAKGESRSHYYDLTIEPLLDSSGAIAGVTCAALDITERKQADEALRESEMRFATLFRGSPAAICLTTFHDGRFVDVNGAFEHFLGYSRAELIGRTSPDLDIWPEPHSRQRVLEALTDRNSLSNVDIQFRRKSGEMVPTLTSFEAIELSGTLYILGVSLDITERKRSEEALHRSEERLRALIENSTDGIALINPRGIVRFASPATSRILGYSLDEFVGRNALELIHPEDADGAVAVIRDILEKPGHIEWSEYRARHKDGTWRWLNGSVQNLLAEPSVRALIVNYRDVTESKRAEAEILQRNRELEMVNRISTALRAAQTLDEMMPILLDETLEALDTDCGTIVLHDPARDQIIPVVARGWLTEIYVPGAYPSNVGITGQVLATGEVFTTRELAQDPDLRADIRAAVPAGWGGAAVPIFSAQSIVGILDVSVKLPREISADELRLLQTVADIAGNAIHRMKLHEQALRRADQLAAVNTLGQALAETLEVQEIYERLYSATTQLLPDICGMVVSHYDASSRRLISDYGRVDGKLLAADQLPIVPIKPDGKGPQSEAITTRRPLVVNDLQARLPQATIRIPIGDTPVPESGLYIPMLIKGDIFGTLVVQSYTPNRFTADEAELLSTIANTSAVALENARLFTETNRRLQYLQALRTIDNAITASLDLRVTLNVLLEQITAQLKVDAASILLLNAHSHILEYAAGRGFYTQGITRSRLRLGEGHAGRAALERRMISEPNMQVAVEGPSRAKLIAGEEFISYYGLPLIAKGQVKGVLDVFNRSLLTPDTEWIEFLETLANQAAIAIDSAQLFEDLQRSNTELSLAYDATIEGWSRALDLRDKETEGHSQRVAEMTLRLARAIGAFSDLELVHIRRGALLHDIGKMGIPDQILLKTDALTEEEWVIMRQHPIYAFELLSPISYLRPALDIPYSHHEKWDGTGYPRGLKGEQIPLAARIFAVVDVWDALRSQRPYRPAWPAEQVRNHIRTLIGTHFDPDIVHIFLDMLNDASFLPRI